MNVLYADSNKIDPCELLLEDILSPQLNLYQQLKIKPSIVLSVQKVRYLSYTMEFTYYINVRFNPKTNPYVYNSLLIAL